jgi:hypothetical protein
MFLMLFILLLISVFLFFMLPILVLGLTFWFPSYGRSPLLCLKKIKKTNKKFIGTSNKSQWQFDRVCKTKLKQLIIPWNSGQDRFLTEGKSMGVVSFSWKASLSTFKSKGCMRALLSLEVFWISWSNCIPSPFLISVSPTTLWR